MRSFRTRQLDDPLGLVDLRAASRKPTQSKPTNPLIVHKRLPNKLRRQILLSQPYENEEFLKNFTERDTIKTTPKVLLELRRLTSESNSAATTSSSTAQADQIHNLLHQVSLSTAELSPLMTAEVIDIMCKLDHDQYLLPFVNSLLNRSDIPSLGIAIASLMNTDRPSLCKALGDHLIRCLEEEENLDKVPFEDSARLLVILGRAPSFLAVAELVTRTLCDNVLSGISGVLDPRKLLQMPLAVMRANVNTKLKVECMHKLCTRLDALVTSRMPCRCADKIEAYAGLSLATTSGIACARTLLDRWRLFTRMGMPDSDDERLRVRHACERIGIAKMVVDVFITH